MHFRFLTTSVRWLITSIVMILMPINFVMAADVQLWPNAEL